MTRSQRPYLIRALYDWLLDCGHTPYLLVAAHEAGVAVPEGFINPDGKIILNLAPQAVHGLSLGNDEIRFSARFGGTPMTVIVPPRAVLAIYAKESGAGMLFGEPEAADSAVSPAAARSDQQPEPPKPAGEGGKRAHLRVVK